MKDAALQKLFLRFRDKADGRALATVFDLTARDLVRVAAHLVDGADEAEDLVQLTFVKAIERAHAYDPKQGRFSGWLYGILWREAARVRRKRSRQSALAVDESNGGCDTDTAQLVAERELPELVRDALERMPASYREVVAPVLLDGKRPTEVAAELGRAPGTVRAQIQRGLERLRRSLPRDLATWGWIGLPRGLQDVRNSVLEAGGSSAAASAGPIAVGVTFAQAAVSATPATLACSVAAAGGTAALAITPLLTAPEPADPTPDPTTISSSQDPMNAQSLLALPLALGLATAPAQNAPSRQPVVVTSVEAKVEKLHGLVGDLLEIAQSDSPDADVAWEGLMGAIGQLESEYQARKRAEQQATAKRGASPWHAKHKQWIADGSQFDDLALRDATFQDIHAALIGGDPEGQRVACRALAALREVDVDFSSFREPVHAIALSGDAELRVAALYALFNTNRRPEDVELALALAQDPSPAAIDSASHLIFLYHDGDLTGRGGEAVLSMLQTENHDTLDEVMGGIWGARVSPGLEERLLEISHTEDRSLRHNAIYFGLSTLADKSPAVIERLVEVLADPDPNNHGRALWGLGHGVPEENGHMVAAAMRRLFENRNASRMRTDALELIGRYGDPMEDGPWLETVRDNPDAPESVRKGAASALERLEQRR